MHIEKSIYNEEVVIYASREEEMAAIRAFLDGNYGELTALEVQEFKSIQKDPDGIKFDRDHAGMFSCEVDPLDFRGLVFIYDVGKNFADGERILREMIGPHPITPLTLWKLERQLNNLATESTKSTECFRTPTP